MSIMSKTENNQIMMRHYHLIIMHPYICLALEKEIAQKTYHYLLRPNSESVISRKTRAVSAHFHQSKVSMNLPEIFLGPRIWKYLTNVWDLEQKMLGIPNSQVKFIFLLDF